MAHVNKYAGNLELPGGRTVVPGDSVTLSKEDLEGSGIKAMIKSKWLAEEKTTAKKASSQ